MQSFNTSRGIPKGSDKTIIERFDFLDQFNPLGFSLDGDNGAGLPSIRDFTWKNFEKVMKHVLNAALESWTIYSLSMCALMFYAAGDNITTLPDVLETIMMSWPWRHCNAEMISSFVFNFLLQKYYSAEFFSHMRNWWIRSQSIEFIANTHKWWTGSESIYYQKGNETSLDKLEVVVEALLSLSLGVIGALLYVGSVTFVSTPSEDTPYPHHELQPFKDQFANDSIYYYGYLLLYLASGAMLTKIVMKIAAQIAYNFCLVFDHELSESILDTIKRRIIKAAQTKQLAPFLDERRQANRKLIAEYMGSSNGEAVAENTTDLTLQTYLKTLRDAKNKQKMTPEMRQSNLDAYLAAPAITNHPVFNKEVDHSNGLNSQQSLSLVENLLMMLTKSWQAINENKLALFLCFSSTCCYLGFIYEASVDPDINRSLKAVSSIVNLTTGCISAFRVAAAINNIRFPDDDLDRPFYAYHEGSTWLTSLKRKMNTAFSVYVALTFFSTGGVINGSFAIFGKLPAGWRDLITFFAVIGCMSNNSVSGRPMISSALNAWSRFCTYTRGMKKSHISNHADCEYIVENIDKELQDSSPRAVLKALYTANYEGEQRTVLEAVPGYLHKSIHEQYKMAEKILDLPTRNEAFYNVRNCIAQIFMNIFSQSLLTSLQEVPAYGIGGTLLYYACAMLVNVLTRIIEYKNNIQPRASWIEAATNSNIWIQALTNTLMAFAFDKFVLVWGLSSLVTRNGTLNPFVAEDNHGIVTNPEARAVGSIILTTTTSFFFKHKAEPTSGDLEARQQLISQQTDYSNV